MTTSLEDRTEDAGSAALRRLDGLQNFERSGHLEAPTTRRVSALVGVLGDPHRAYPVVHVTGTNGKGSTTAMIAARLTGQGMRVGTYTSPHLDRLTERITVGGIRLLRRSWGRRSTGCSGPRRRSGSRPPGSRR